MLDFPELALGGESGDSAGSATPLAPPSDAAPTVTRLPTAVPAAGLAPVAGAAAPSDAAPTAVPGAGAGTVFRSGFGDPRLYADQRSLARGALPGLEERLNADAAARIGALRDTLATEPHDLLYNLSRGFYPNGMRILPADRGAWELYELYQERERFARDSILRDRARATRERKARDR